MPTGWRDHIAGVGYGANGDSGAAPPGSTAPEDAHIVLEIPVSLPGGAPLGPAPTKTITIHHTFGRTSPAVELPCPWDCGNGNGAVDVADLLAVLAQWDPDAPLDCTGGTCDFDADGCVGVTELLKLLAHWGDCPGCLGPGKCDDGNACTIDSCIDGICVNEPLSPGACDDGDHHRLL